MLYLSLMLLLTPFATGCVIASWHRARTFVARHYWPCIALGWTAVVLLAPAAIALEGAHRSAALALLCPWIGLSFWRRGDDDGGGGGEDPPDPPPTDGPSIDWEEFRREIDEYVAQRSRPVHAARP